MALSPHKPRTGKSSFLSLFPSAACVGFTYFSLYPRHEAGSRGHVRDRRPHARRRDSIIYGITVFRRGLWRVGGLMRGSARASPALRLWYSIFSRSRRPHRCSNHVYYLVRGRGVVWLCVWPDLGRSTAATMCSPARRPRVGLAYVCNLYGAVLQPRVEAEVGEPQAARRGYGERGTNSSIASTSSLGIEALSIINSVSRRLTTRRRR